MKKQERKRAIELRKQGFTYREILEQVPVAKSTLSRWLRDVGLAKRQKQRITAKRTAARIKGHKVWSRMRKKAKQKIIRKAQKEAEDIELDTEKKFLMGVMLYWAEGSKEKEYSNGITMEFCNSDAIMMRFFVEWLIEVLDVSHKRIKAQVLLHESHKYRKKEVLNHWKEQIGHYGLEFGRIYYKKHNPKTNRRNTDSSYYGVLRVRITKSSDLVRKVEGWVNGLMA